MSGYWALISLEALQPVDGDCPVINDGCSDPATTTPPENGGSPIASLDGDALGQISRLVDLSIE
ncbi:hypothetical protein Halru_1630 [Halovivax ruber XH-70]|uniref:Uncharacterized protein n=1 Tax=Halovivax ruber (strain DSM 18193 / JCM 13892 / XH-70) TaxID=797302 RepID=L0IE48_HALRX|nr:hypothetical protein Halru_1630 [Halovivax ruber XH-70]